MAKLTQILLIYSLALVCFFSADILIVRRLSTTWVTISVFKLYQKFFFSPIILFCKILSAGLKHGFAATVANDAFLLAFSKH